MKKLLILLTGLFCLTCCNDGMGQATEELDSAGVNTLLSVPQYTYTDCAAEWAPCKFTGSATVRYGDSVKGVDYYVTKTFTAGNLYPGTGITCRNDVFGKDPHPGSLTKRCAIQGAVVPVPSTDVYVSCAPEWGTCNFTGTRKVRFGNPGKYVYGTFTNTVRCRNDVFGSDPDVGFSKSCAYLDSQVSVDAGVAQDASVVVPKDAGIVFVDAGQAKPQDAAVVPIPAPVGGSTAVRPSYNKGVGFFVYGGKLYDANGNEFVIRGVNKVHWDAWSQALNKINANTVRWTIDFNQPVANNVNLLMNSPMRTGTVAQQTVVIPGNWNGTCKEDTASLSAIVDTWVAQVDGWKPLEKFMILNISNEWGPNNSTVWRDSYITAIKRLRAAGYHCTIMVTSGGCGQDAYDLVNYGKDVFNADPELNVILDQHVYGYARDPEGGATGGFSDQPTITQHFADLKALGIPAVIGEFGPSGLKNSPSPTNVLPQRIMQIAQQNGLGWLAWAADDGSSTGNDDTWFAMFKDTSVYNTSSDLTTFGRIVVEDPTYGLKVVAKKASIF